MTRTLLTEGKAYAVLAALFAIGTSGTSGLGSYLLTVLVVTVTGTLAWVPFVKKKDSVFVRYMWVPFVYVCFSLVYAVLRMQASGLLANEATAAAFYRNYSVALAINFATAILASAISPLLSRKVELAGSRRRSA